MEENGWKGGQPQLASGVGTYFERGVLARAPHTPNGGKIPDNWEYLPSWYFLQGVEGIGEVPGRWAKTGKLRRV